MTAHLYLPPLFRYQRDLLQSRAREVVVISATQIGKTFACAVWLLYVSWCVPGQLNWWVAPTKKQCKTGYRILKRLARNAKILADFKDGDLNLTLNNGTEIDFRSWDVEDNLAGESIYACVVDEAGQLTEKARSIISTRRSATLGPIRYIGNPTAQMSQLWLLWKQSQSEDHPSIEGMKWTYKDRARGLAGDRLRQYLRFIRDERKNMSRDDFRRLYLAEFLELGAGVIDFRPICTSPGDEINMISVTKQAWFEPWDSEIEGPCVGGLDFGQKDDWTFLTIWTRRSGRLKAAYRTRHDRWKVIIQRVIEIAKQYAVAKPIPEGEDGGPKKRSSLILCYDSNNVGQAVGEHLDEVAYGTGVIPNGVHFSSDSKQDMVSAIQMTVEHENGSMPWIKELIHEADTLERTVLATSIRYAHGKGFKDDGVWSAGLALNARRRITSGVPV